MLTKYFEPDRSLAGDHIHIIIGMNKDHASLLGLGRRIRIGIIIGITRQVLYAHHNP